MLPLSTALEQSVNAVYARLAIDIGAQNVANMAYKLGIPKSDHLPQTPSVILGAGGVSPLDMAHAYSTIAAQGIRRQLLAVTKVTPYGGKPVLTPASKNKGHRVIRNGATWQLTQYLDTNVHFCCTGTNANVVNSGLPYRAQAGKTGTTDNYTDAWFCGYTPNLAACVWVGYPKGEISMDLGGTDPGPGVRRRLPGDDLAPVRRRGLPATSRGSSRRPHGRWRRRSRSSSCPGSRSSRSSRRRTRARSTAAARAPPAAARPAARPVRLVGRRRRHDDLSAAASAHHDAAAADDLMSVGSRADLLGLVAAGRVVAEALARMRALVRPGATTAELDRAAAGVFARHGARSAPQLAYGFPGVTCISVNDEAVHGIPGRRRIEPGDLVKLDVTAELGGYMADAAVTVPVPPVAAADAALCEAAAAGLAAALERARAGATTGAVGAAVEREVERRGFRVLRELAGHGIGHTIHEPPSVPNFGAAGLGEPLTDGLVITLEPIVAATTRSTRRLGDGWTVATADGGRSAHVEHTIVVGRGRPLILTA